MSGAASRRRSLRRACLLGVAGAALNCAPALALGPVGDQHRVSFSGADMDPDIGGREAAVAENARSGEHLITWNRSRDPSASLVAGRLVDAQGVPLGAEMPISDPGRHAFGPAVAYNADRNEFLVAYSRQLGGTGEREIFVRRVDAAGAPIGDDQRISQMGPDGDPQYDAGEPTIAYDGQRHEYLVAWSGTDLGVQEYEIYARRVSQDGLPLGADDLRVSSMGPDGSPDYGAFSPDVAYDERHDEYLVTWAGDDDTPPYVSREYEIYVQRITADGAEAGADDRRVSDLGPPGDNEYRADQPAIAYDAATDEFMVAFRGHDDQPTASAYEIFVQRLAFDGAEVGADDQRISSTGPYPDISLTGDPDIAFDTRAGEYLVTWSGADGTIPSGKREVFAQRLSSAGAEIEGDVRVSSMPDEARPEASGVRPAVAYDSRSNRYAIAWQGTSTVAPLDPGKTEIYTRRFEAGTPVAIASAQCKALAPAAAPSAGNPAAVALSRGQLLINQRISQAAVRRANGIQGWFGHGVEARDLCQASLTTAELYPGSIGGYTGLPQTYGPPDPRPVVVARASAGNPSKVTLSVGQLLINQRISQAAVRRLNALKARLDAGLTGGDVIDGQVGRPQLAAGTSVLFTPVPAAPVAASATSIAPARPGDPSKVSLSAAQLLINQRISQAAVRRANELVRRLGQGIGAPEIADGTLSAADLAPGVALSTTP